MADIKVLPKHLAELIAAGEVVERPASVIKELTENAIDAGATKITVEIQRGGITYMRVTDNGIGIRHDQVPTAFLRHATSKIKSENDLYSIGTLGFRGEALASISSVAKVELLTKTAEGIAGTRYVIEGGEEKEYDEAGCPEGTTIIVRDIFYNIPARMKFLKKDVSEAMAVAAVMDNIALCNPNIAIKFIKDSKTVLSTNGDGKLISVIYEVLGREFANSLIPVDATTHGVRITGMTCKPVYCRSARSGQYFFLNGRMIRSGAAAKALDTAYKNSVMVGKFPACVLFIDIPLDRVDVNVHPSKTEVRFTDEKAVFEAIYYAVKDALIKQDVRPELTFKAATTVAPKAAPTFARISAEEYKKMSQKDATPVETIYKETLYRPSVLKSNDTAVFKSPIKITKPTPQSDPKPDDTVVIVSSNNDKEVRYSDLIKDTTVPAVSQETAFYSNMTFADDVELELKYIGEAYKTYIIVEFKGSIYFIDKHAAHERILFEKFKKERTVQPQLLLSPISVTLSRAEHRAVLENLDLLKEAGFDIEEFGTSSVLVRSVPTELANEDVMFTVCEIADNLLKSGKVENERLENLYHTVACRAAIKGGNNQSAAELEQLAKRILCDKDIMYCPHGRPVAFELKRSELERQFGRTN